MYSGVPQSYHSLWESVPSYHVGLNVVVRLGPLCLRGHLAGFLLWSSHELAKCSQCSHTTKHVLALVNSFCAVNGAVIFRGCGTAHREHSAWRWSVWAALGSYFTLVMNSYA